MGPRRGDTICGHVVIDALAPMHFGARALGPVYLARAPDEPRIWLTVVERTLVPRSVDISRFMAGAGALLHVAVPGAIDVVLVDREADFCVVGHRAATRTQTLASIAEAGPDEIAALALAGTLGRTLAELHARGTVHGLLTATTVLAIDGTWCTWQHGIAPYCAPDKLLPRLRPLGGDPVAPDVRDGAPLSPGADVFAWGAAVACLLTGEVGSAAIAALSNDDRDDPLRSLVRRTVEAHARDRPADGNALMVELEAVIRAVATAQPQPDSGDFSFADLFDDVEPPPLPSAQAQQELVRLHEELDLLVVEEDPDDPLHARREAARSAGVSSMPVRGMQESAWRDLAERYLAEEPAKPRVLRDDDPRPRPVPGDDATPVRTTAELARLALVRVRTGPQRAIRSDPLPSVGEWTIPDEPAPEPPPPPCDPDAKPLPSGVRMPEGDGDDPPLFAFPDPETGEIIIVGPAWNGPPRDDGPAESAMDDPATARMRASEAAPAGPDDTPRLKPLPSPPRAAPNLASVRAKEIAARAERARRELAIEPSRPPAASLHPTPPEGWALRDTGPTEPGSETDVGAPGPPEPRGIPAVVWLIALAAIAGAAVVLASMRW